MKNVNVSIELSDKGPVFVKMILFRNRLDGSVDPDSKHIHRAGFDLSMSDEAFDFHLRAISDDLQRMGAVRLSREVEAEIKRCFDEQLATYGRPPVFEF